MKVPGRAGEIQGFWPSGLGPRPTGAPGDFYARVARALKTTDPSVLRDAGAAYRGVYESEHAYVVEQVAALLRLSDMRWLLACCEPGALREVYERRTLVVWSIALDHDGCMVFESVRHVPEQPGELQLADEADESAAEVWSPTEPNCSKRDIAHRRTKRLPCRPQAVSRHSKASRSR